MILFNPTSSYLWLNFLSSQGTEVNKNSISYTSVVSPQTKEKKKKDKKNKERVWGQTSILAESFFACWGCTESHRKHAESSAYHHVRHVWLFVWRIWLSCNMLRNRHGKVNSWSRWISKVYFYYSLFSFFFFFFFLHKFCFLKKYFFEQGKHTNIYLQSLLVGRNL